ncbi:MAG: hypothetical protein M1825_003405 [Sarcosagium campestre]|nr:MAG: hypothetical protein M1825_003405 [Sarcosagium campestre]
MAIDYRSGISIFEILLYSPCLIVALWLALRHGFGRNSGWIFLVLFTLVRLVGSSTQLISISNRSKNVAITDIICQSIGLSPLILVCVGLLSRANDSSGNLHYKKIVPPIIFRIISLLSLIGVILCIVGVTDSTGSVNGNFGKPAIQTKVGVMLFLLAWFVLCLLLGVITLHISKIELGERRLVLAVAVSIPFLFVRLIYSVLSVYSENEHFNPLTGSVTVKLFMAILEELVVILTCLAVGIMLRVIPKSEKSAAVGSHVDSRPQSEGKHAGRGAPSRGGSWSNTGGSRPPPRRHRQKQRRRGGPIHQLVGLAVDRY